MNLLLTKAKEILNPIHSRLDWQMRRSEPVMQEAVQRWFAFNTNQIQIDLRTKFQKDITSELTDWEYLKTKGKDTLKPATLTVMQKGGQQAYNVFKVKGAFDIVNEESVKAANEFTADLVTQVNAETKKGIRTFISAGIKEGKSMDTISRELRPIVGLTERQAQSVIGYKNILRDKEKFPKLTSSQIDSKVTRYANKTQRRRMQTISRTETARAQNIGYAQGMQDIGIEELEFSRSSGACAICSPLDGKKYNVKVAGGIIPVHPNCLTGDSLISPRGNITGASKRWYNGQIHIIKTATNRIICCTKNHPILTNRGFVPADSLNIGSQIISHGIGQGETFSDWQDINKPALIEDIAESFFSSPGVITKEVPVSSIDFHNDGIGSKVAIIGTDSLLMGSRDTSIEQHILKDKFVLRKVAWSLFNRFCMFAFGRPTDSSPTSRIMGSFDLFLSLLIAHLRPLESFRLALIPNMDIRVQQSFANTPSAISKMQGNSVLRPAKNIQIDNSTDNFFVDSIVHISTSKYSNYVYNLETTESYYIANGIASHNCRCAMIPVVGDDSIKHTAAAMAPKKLNKELMISLVSRLKSAKSRSSELALKDKLRKLGYDVTGKPFSTSPVVY